MKRRRVKADGVIEERKNGCRRHKRMQLAMRFLNVKKTLLTLFVAKRATTNASMASGKKRYGSVAIVRTNGSGRTAPDARIAEVAVEADPTYVVDGGEW